MKKKNKEKIRVSNRQNPHGGCGTVTKLNVKILTMLLVSPQRCIAVPTAPGTEPLPSESRQLPPQRQDVPVGCAAACLQACENAAGESPPSCVTQRPSPPAATISSSFAPLILTYYSSHPAHVLVTVPRQGTLVPQSGLLYYRLEDT